MNQASFGRVFLLLVAVGFVALTALRIHGSSIVQWSIILNEEKTAEALLSGRPREIRSDEWLVWTPSLLAQARHQPPFPIENPALGAARSPMLMNLPTRHWSTLFRPQLWGYFLFDLEHGFAWHWNMKIFGLLAAMFLLVRKLSGGSVAFGLFGSAWVFCSSYIQWWFSCPPMLPEMLASWSLALWCVLKLTESPRRPAALALTGGLVVAAVNFALCMYPPYQIPLAYLGLAILGGWLWQRRAEAPASIAEAPTPVRWFPAAGWLLVAIAAVALVVVPFFVELLPTLHLVEGTSYPGARRTTGGALSFANLFLGFAEPFIHAHSFPEKRDSICSAANFYPIWLAAGCWLIATARQGLTPGRRLLWPIFGCLLAFTLFALCPLPAIVGRITLLSLTTEERLILPIGIGGILLSVLAWREMKADATYPVASRLALLAVCVGGALLVLLFAAADSHKFFTPWRFIAVLACALVLFALYLWPLTPCFAIALLCALGHSALRVNPVTCGLAPLTESTAFSAIDEIRRADPEAAWLAFDGANPSAFLMSAGVHVLSGAKTLPDLAFYRELDPTGRDLGIYNRYSLGIFLLAPQPAPARFKLFNFCAHSVEIHPTDPALRARHVRYFVFPKPLADPAASGLQSLKSLPERHLWIYRLAGV